MCENSHKRGEMGLDVYRQWEIFPHRMTLEPYKQVSDSRRYWHCSYRSL